MRRLKVLMGGSFGKHGDAKHKARIRDGEPEKKPDLSPGPKKDLLFQKMRTHIIFRYCGNLWLRLGGKPDSLNIETWYFWLFTQYAIGRLFLFLQDDKDFFYATL